MTVRSKGLFAETSNIDLTSIGLDCSLYKGLRRLLSVLAFHHIYRYRRTGDMRHYLRVWYSRRMQYSWKIRVQTEGLTRGEDKIVRAWTKQPGFMEYAPPGLCKTQGGCTLLWQPPRRLVLPPGAKRGRESVRQRVRCT